jgi:hypothetical protein
MMNAVGSRMSTKVLNKKKKLKISSTFTEKEVMEVNGVFDEDGNGLVEERELVNWIVSGINRTREERADFAETSELAAKLDVFLLCVLLVVGEWHERHQQEHLTRMTRRNARGGGKKEVHRVGIGEMAHVDSWDATFNEMELSMRATSVTAADLAQELDTMALNFESRMENIESRMRKEMMDNSMRSASSISFSSLFTPDLDKASKERIRFLEARVELLCTKLGLQDEPFHKIKKKETIPYSSLTLHTKETSPSRSMTSSKSKTQMSIVVSRGGGEEERLMGRRRRGRDEEEKEKNSGGRRGGGSVGKKIVAQDRRVMTLQDVVSSDDDYPEDDSGDESHDYIIHVDDDDPEENSGDESHDYEILMDDLEF